MNSQQQYISLFEETRTMIDEYSAPIINARRQEAFEAFQRIGLPDRKNERYKYTNLREVFAPDFGLNLKRLRFPVNPYDTFSCGVPNISTTHFFIVNDAFYDDTARRPALPEGVIVGSLREQSLKNPDFIEPYYGRLADVEADAPTALNTMFAQDGLLVYVPAGVKVDRPIQVINLLRADVDLMINRRVLIVVEPGAEVRLLFCDHAVDRHHFLATQVIEAYVGEDARLDLYCMEETHELNSRISNVYIKQAARSVANHNVITLHNGLTRNTLDLYFEGEGARCSLAGAVIADKQQHVDNNTRIFHNVPGCTSEELYKYVLDGNATGAFAGLVHVRKDAQQTASEMRNQNICATKQARMYTQPMLEIYADDVKCAHGSTVGQLNEAALFYMRQRGISEREARLLLEFAFINEVIDRMDLEPLKERLHLLVERRFRGVSDMCEGCHTPC